jgi:oligopeptide transport system ATP-binding protein
VEEQRRRVILEGDVPSPASPPVGCNFNTRCPAVMDECYEKEPEFVDVGDGHWVACFRV